MDKSRVSRKSVVLKFVIPYFIFFVLICIPIYLVYYNSYKQNFIYDVSYMMEDVSANILEWISEYSVKVDAAENFIKSDLPEYYINLSVSNVKASDKEIFDIYFGNTTMPSMPTVSDTMFIILIRPSFLKVVCDFRL